jgi:hypothetical protein
MATFTATEKISTRILTLVHNGSTVPQAMDAVLGAGTHAAIAGELYDRLRARQARIDAYLAKGRPALLQELRRIGIRGGAIETLTIAEHLAKMDEINERYEGRL